MILLDTNVVSELMKAVAHPSVDRWFVENEDQTWLPAPVLGELAYGISRLPMGRRRNELNAKLTEWHARYALRIQSFDAGAALAYGPMLAAVIGRGRTMTLPDAQIAAIALDRDAVLATRNIRDFAVIALTVVDPWQL